MAAVCRIAYPRTRRSRESSGCWRLGLLACMVEGMEAAQTGLTGGLAVGTREREGQGPGFKVVHSPVLF